MYFMPSTFSVKAKAITTNADRIIQKTAPHPPTEIAVATPIIFPVPIEAARAVDNACVLEIPFSELLFSERGANKVLLRTFKG